MKISDFEFENRSDNFKKISRRAVLSADEILSDSVRALYTWWAKFHPDMPKRSNFDIAEHWKIAPHIHILQFIKPGHYLYRLNGEKVVDIVGVSRRGDTITVENPLPEDRLFASYLDDIVSEAKPKRCVGTLGLFDKTHSQFESVDCPVKNEAGEIEFIIGAITTLENHDATLD
ncbi:PAS domain-containing protein [Sneathiella marina]|uniref:PAS domain-containing protein n=1 Tax=Sneathiella marina TaxID=2950108 RepID=A0ABY4WBT9_9PROT|nr:PAS domain-containing protein [Sneathiella marina]USG63235.1 PAS domain-containing protein [Sneathiella marina]